MDINSELKNLIEEAVDDNIFVAASIGIYYRNQDIFNKILISSSAISDQNIKNELIYDLASLTKPLSTVLIVLSLIKEGKLSLTDTISDIFNNKSIPGDKNSITIAQLLSHSAGFPAHKPYFKELASKSLVTRKDVLFKYVLAEE